MKELCIRTVKLIKKGDYRWIPSSLSFYFIVSIIPMIFSILLILVRYAVDKESILRIFDGTDTISIFFRDFLIYINEGFSNVNIIVLIGLLLYSTFLSSNGIRGVMYAINSFFGLKKLSYVKATALSYIVSLLFIMLLFAGVIFISLLPPFIDLIKVDLNITKTYIFVLPIIYLVIHFTYRTVSGFDLKSKDIYKGALFSSIFIYIIVVFSSYFVYLSKASVIFGSLAALILLSHFILYISYGIYFGIAINVADLQLRQEKDESKEVEVQGVSENKATSKMNK
ncbi:MAG: YhjD/YihY/BrkB family envelope integrity protein [Erysipelotrichales bacterium]